VWAAGSDYLSPKRATKWTSSRASASTVVKTSRGQVFQVMTSGIFLRVVTTELGTRSDGSSSFLVFQLVRARCRVWGLGG
jgi:hypothetical protein